MTHDVVIIGAGPAGLCAGIALATSGISTLVCEARALPNDKACGEGLMPTAVRDLALLGISRRELYQRGWSLEGVRYVSASGVSAQAPFEEGDGLGVRRTALSEILLARSRELPHLTVRTGARASLYRNRKGWCVALPGATLQPRLVIGADGLNSRVRQWAGLPHEKVAPARWGMRRHFRVRHALRHVEVHWQHGLEAYLTPIGPEEMDVAILWDEDVAPSAKGEQLLAALLARFFPTLDGWLTDAEASSTPRAAGPMRRNVPRRAVDGLLLVGDAAGYVDAITGEGIGLAVRQALRLKEHVAPLLCDSANDVIVQSQLSPYLAAVDQTQRDHRQLTSLLLSLKRRPAVIERCIAALAADSRLFTHFLSANMGQTRPWRLPLRSLPGLIHHLLVPSRPGTERVFQRRKQLLGLPGCATESNPRVPRSV